MPIRFRCAYCNQLMGIGRRKAGAVVRCPRCAGEVIVPAEHEGPAADGDGPLNDLLESEEFGKALADLEPMARPMPNPLMPPPAYVHPPLREPRPPPPPVPPPVDSMSEAFPRDLRRPGLFLPTPMLVVAVALLIASLGVTFVLGMVVRGMFR
jgi:hypothetical protein